MGEDKKTKLEREAEKNLAENVRKAYKERADELKKTYSRRSLKKPADIMGRLILLKQERSWRDFLRQRATGHQISSDLK